MQRFRPAVGLLAIAILSSSVVGGAVAATGDFGPAARPDRPELARPVPQDEPSGVPACPARDSLLGTCVKIDNRTTGTTLEYVSLDAGDGKVYVEAPKTVSHGSSGEWVTGGPVNTSQVDRSHARYSVQNGPTVAIDYQTTSVLAPLFVTVESGNANQAPYCEVASSRGQDHWVSHVITFTDYAPAVVAFRGTCAALAEDGTPYPTPTPGASSAAPAPGGP
jgi:hypothetical protein